MQPGEQPTCCTAGCATQLCRPEFLRLSPLRTALLSSPAVVTGVQIHNWAYDFEDASPNMEFVAPTSAYVVVDGVKTHLDLSAIPVSHAA